jgi:uncharacterized protein (DUF433 family)
MGITTRLEDPLSGGFYSTRDAARLLRIDNARRIRRWVAGHSRGEPAILRDYEPVNGQQALSFWDLMEVRFLEHFRKQGVPLQTLRKAAEKARKEMQNRHPFALSNVKFLTDRRRIFGRAAEEEGDARTWDLATNQYEMYEAIEQVLAKGVAFDPVTGLAQSWHPLPEYKNVLIHPRLAFGRPVVGENKVPTKAVFLSWKAGGGDKARVARWFHMKHSEVAEAVDFELTLTAA